MGKCCVCPRSRGGTSLKFRARAEPEPGAFELEPKSSRAWLNKKFWRSPHLLRIFFLCPNYTKQKILLETSVDNDKKYTLKRTIFLDFFEKLHIFCLFSWSRAWDRAEPRLVPPLPRSKIIFPGLAKNVFFANAPLLLAWRAKIDPSNVELSALSSLSWTKQGFFLQRQRRIRANY